MKRRIKKACEACRLRKKKCNGEIPCKRCAELKIECLYQTPDQESSQGNDFKKRRLQKLYATIGKSLEELESLSCNDLTRLQEGINDVRHIFEGIKGVFSLPASEIPISAEAELEETSIETKLVRNFNIEFTKFDRRFSKCSVSSKDISLNWHFGLYSSVMSLSPMGIVWTLQRFRGNQTFATNEKIDLTSKILLKYLDICAHRHLKHSAIQCKGPLLSYGIIRGIADQSSNSLFDIIFGESLRLFPSLGISEGENSSRFAYGHLTLYVDTMRAHVMKLFVAKCVSPTELSRFFDQNLCISSLVGHMLQLLLFEQSDTAVVFNACVDYLFLRLNLDSRELSRQTLSALIERAFQRGINRWEYYIGKKEGISELNRVAWFRIYCLDKTRAHLSGKEPFIQSNQCRCLLPKLLVSHNIYYSMDFVSILKAFHPCSFDEGTLHLFAELLIAKSIEESYSQFLLSPELTDEFTLEMAVFREEVVSKKPDVIYRKLTELVSWREAIESFRARFREVVEQPDRSEELIDIYMNMNSVYLWLFQSIDYLLCRIRTSLKSFLVNKPQLPVFEKIQEEVSACSEISADCTTAPLLFLTSLGKDGLWLKFIQNVSRCFLSFTIHFLEGSMTVKHLYLLPAISMVYKKYLLVNRETFNIPPAWMLQSSIFLFLITSKICLQHAKFNLGQHDKWIKDLFPNPLFVNSLLNSDTTLFKDILVASTDGFSYKDVILRNLKKIESQKKFANESDCIISQNEGEQIHEQIKALLKDSFDEDFFERYLQDILLDFDSGFVDGGDPST